MRYFAPVLASFLSLLSTPAQAGIQKQEPPVVEGLETALKLQEGFARLAEHVAPSIVTVAAYVRDPEAVVPPETASASRWVQAYDAEYPGFRRIGSGSGVIVSEDGDILTNRHFLLTEDGKLPDVVDVETVDNRHTICRVVGMEPTLNMAILSLEVFSEKNPPMFKPIRFGNSVLLRPGHWAVAVGDPFGPDKFFTTGILSGSPNRECYQEQRTATYLQVAMQLHPGAMGGALLNLRGELVGMLTPLDPEIETRADFRPNGLEFALPSNIVRGLYSSIKKRESFQSPWLGYAVMSIAELRKERGNEVFQTLVRPRVGIYIENVFTPSPADGAGVQPGDWLTRFGDAWIGSPVDFQKQLYLAGAGSEVQLEFFREGETFLRTLTVEVRPAEATTR